MNTCLLSLCIPTFCRPALLLETLQSVAEQGDAALFERVEVLVSDNASPDDTEQAVRTFAEAHPFLRLKDRRHAENIGSDANMAGLVEWAQGEFVLLLSDDDLLLPGALTALLADIEAHPDVDAFCLNVRAFQKDPALEPTLAAPVFVLDADTRLPDRGACLDLFGTWLTFMSLLAFRRSALSPDGYAGRIGTDLVMGYVFVDALARGAWVRQSPRLAVRDNFSGGYNFFGVFVSRFHDLLAYADLQGCRPGTTRRVYRRHLRRFLFLTLLTFKLRRTGGQAALRFREGAQRLWRADSRDPFVLCLLTLLAAPPFLLRGGYGLVQWVKKLRRAQ